MYTHVFFTLMPCVPHVPWFECPDNTRWNRQITKFIVTEILSPLVTSLFSRLSTYNLSTSYQVRFSSKCCWTFRSSGMWGCSVRPVVPDVQKGLVISRNPWRWRYHDPSKCRNPTPNDTVSQPEKTWTIIISVFLFKNPSCVLPFRWVDKYHIDLGEQIWF